MNAAIAADAQPAIGAAASPQIQAASSVIELDIHRLDLRFERTRLPHGRSRARLAEAIALEGLRLPVRVADTGDALILIDGFRRLEAYRLLARDRIPAHCTRQSLEEALRAWFADQRGRSLDAMEEAWLIEQLLEEGRSRREIAQWMGRGASWISRRLALLEGLSEAARQAVRDGALSSWAAQRVWIPLARANAEDGSRLLEALERTPLSSRELVLWQQHYQAAGGEQRRRLLEHPRLLIDTLKGASAQDRKPDESRAVAPDVRWLRQLDGVLDQLGDLQRRLPEVVEAGLELSALTRMAAQTASAKDRLERIAHTINAII